MIKKHIVGISRDLRNMYEADQNMRTAHLEQGKPWDEKMDIVHTSELKDILTRVGHWIDLTTFGNEAAFHAWILAQHADHDPDFQEYCLALMKGLPSGEVDLSNIAYLEDRVLVAKGLPQKFGTQFHRNSEGKIVPFTIVDIANLDERRSMMGLVPFEDWKD